MVAKPSLEGPASSSSDPAVSDSPVLEPDYKRGRVDEMTDTTLADFAGRLGAMERGLEEVKKMVRDLTVTVSGMPQRAEMSFVQSTVAEWSTKATTDVGNLLTASAEQGAEIQRMKAELNQWASQEGVGSIKADLLASFATLSSTVTGLEQ